MPSRRVPFGLPYKGQDSFWSFRSQPLATSPDMLNFRVREASENRFRGGQRPGLKKLFNEQLGSGNPVRMISQFTESTATGTAAITQSDDFNRANTSFSDASPLGSGWTAASWSPPSGAQSAGSFFIQNNTCHLNERRYDAVIAGNFSYSTSNPYSIQYEILRHASGQAKGWYYIYARMGSGLDYTADGIECRLVMGPTVTSGNVDVVPRLTVYVGSAESSQTTGDTVAVAENTTHTFRVEINGNVVTMYLDDTSLISETIAAQAGARFGIGANNYDTTYDVRIDNALFEGTATVIEPITAKTYLATSSNGTLYVMDDTGALDTISGAAASFASTHGFMAQECMGKLYIADYDPSRVNGSDGTIAGGTTLDAASVSDWTAHSISADTDVVELTSVTGPTAGTYGIASIAAGSLTLSSTAGSNGTATFRVERALKVYDPSDGTVTILSASAGHVPPGCRIICLYRNRLVLSGKNGDERNWFMSELGDPTDWAFAPVESTATMAVAGNSSDAGYIGDVVTALIPYSDDYLIFGCATSIWILSGDPAEGGRIDNLSYKASILDRFAWCFDDGGVLYFMGHDGFYKMLGRNAVLNISKSKLPDELSNIDTQTYEVSLAWDHRQQGVNVFVTRKNTGASQHYFYDPSVDGFFPDQIPDDHGPLVAWDYQADSAAYSYVVLGGRDGYLRVFDAGQKSDDGTAIDSYAVYPPMRTSRDGQAGLLTHLHVTLAGSSDDVDWEIRRGQTSENAVEASAFTSGTFRSNGLQYSLSRRVQGGAICLRLGNDTNNEGWAIEEVLGDFQDSGKLRRP